MTRWWVVAGWQWNCCHYYFVELVVVLGRGSRSNSLGTYCKSRCCIIARTDLSSCFYLSHQLHTRAPLWWVSALVLPTSLPFSRTLKSLCRISFAHNANFQFPLLIHRQQSCHMQPQLLFFSFPPNCVAHRLRCASVSAACVAVQPQKNTRTQTSPRRI